MKRKKSRENNYEDGMWRREKEKEEKAKEEKRIKNRDQIFES